MVCRIVMPISRADRLEIMAKQIADLDFCDYEKKVLLICDNKEIDSHEIWSLYKSKGLDFKCIYTGNGVPYSLDILSRRARITNVWRIIIDELKDESDLVLGIEDDGNFAPDSFLRLEKTFKDKYIQSYCKCGFVSGVEAGRWGEKMIGAWRYKDAEHSIIETVPYKECGIEEVHSAGFYFFLTTAHVIADYVPRFDYFGPDVNFGKQLVDKGYTNFIDYGVRIGHNNGVRDVLVDSGCVVLRYKKENDNLWRRYEVK